MRINTFSKWTLLLLILPLFNNCSKNPVTGRNELSFMSESQEIAMGKEYNPTVLATFGVYEDQKLQDFITRKGMEMAKISHRPNLPYQFKVVDSPVVNAFAVPGGYVY
ncbi:MAG TPA: peptidase M48, partial [Saprospiraceae bacterium]|nr:peptidase M48 [Saprospiraceae bacterium]